MVCFNPMYCNVVLQRFSGFRHAGTYPKKPGGFFGYTHLNKPHPKKTPHFYFNLILVYTLYATNNTGFGFFLKPGFFWILVLFHVNLIAVMMMTVVWNNPTLSSPLMMFCVTAATSGDGASRSSVLVTCHWPSRVNSTSVASPHSRSISDTSLRTWVSE